MALAATSAWTVSVWASTHVHVGPVVHEGALFVHLASLVAGLGSVLAIDFFGLQWMLGRRSLESVITMATGTSPLVWLGFTGLVATGALLSPDLSNALTRTKLLLVLLVGVNGAFAEFMQSRMTSVGQHPSRALLVGGALTALVSQAAWWGATMVGFLTSQH